MVALVLSGGEDDHFLLIDGGNFFGIAHLAGSRGQIQEAIIGGLVHVTGEQIVAAAIAVEQLSGIQLHFIDFSQGRGFDRHDLQLSARGHLKGLHQLLTQLGRDLLGHSRVGHQAKDQYAWK